MNRDRLRLTPRGTFTTGEGATGAVAIGRWFPIRGGIALPAAGGAGGSSSIKRFRIETVSNDYLICKAVDADGTVPEGAALYYIAKPAELRGSTYHGVQVGGWGYSVDAGAQNRTAVYEFDDGAFIQGMRLADVCEPGYNAGYTFIFASQVIPNTGVDDPNTADKLTWLDLNVDARKWMPPRIMVSACLNGVVTPIVIRGGT